MQNRHRDALRRIAQAERNLSGEPSAFHLVVTFGGAEIVHPTWDRSWAVPSEHTIDDLLELGLLRDAGRSQGSSRAFTLTMAGRQTVASIEAEKTGVAAAARPPELPRILMWLLAIHREQPSCFELPQRLLDRAVSEGLIEPAAREALALSILQLRDEGYLQGTENSFDQASPAQRLEMTDGLAPTMRAYAEAQSAATSRSDPSPQSGTAPEPAATAAAPPDSRATSEIPVKVAILWAHGDPIWTDQETRIWHDTVLSFTHLLRGNGFEAELDLFNGHLPVDWSRFGPRAINNSDFVLVAVSPQWRRVWDGDNDPTQNAGAVGEANTLRGLFQQDQHTFLERVFPIVLPGRTAEDIPTELRATSRWSSVPELTDDGLEDLVRLLNRDAPYPRPPIGPRRHFGPRGVGVPTDGDLQTAAVETELSQSEAAYLELPAQAAGDESAPSSQARASLEARIADLRADLDDLTEGKRSSTRENVRLEPHPGWSSGTFNLHLPNGPLNAHMVNRGASALRILGATLTTPFGQFAGRMWAEEPRPLRAEPGPAAGLQPGGHLTIQFGEAELIDLAQSSEALSLDVRIRADRESRAYALTMTLHRAAADTLSRPLWRPKNVAIRPVDTDEDG